MPPIGGGLIGLVAFGCYDTYISPQLTKKEIANSISNKINIICNRINIIPNRKYLNFIIISKNKNGFNTSNGIKINKGNKKIYEKHIKTFN